MDSENLKEDKLNWWVDRMYLQDVWKAAASHSVDPNTQVASALVVPNMGGIVLASWNQVPKSIRLTSNTFRPEWKNYYTEHAERSVLYTAIKNGVPTNGLQMYCTWAACAECARAIIDFGVKRVVTFRRLVEMTSPKWEESIKVGVQLMVDSGVQVIGWSGDIASKQTIRFGGKQISASELL